MYSLCISDEWEYYIPDPPDGGWGWVVMVASFFNNFIVDGISYGFGVYLKEYLDFFSSTRGETSLANALLCGVYLLVGMSLTSLHFYTLGTRPIASCCYSIISLAVTKSVVTVF